MAEKPKRASEYRSEQIELVRATCLYVATKLGDLMAGCPRALLRMLAPWILMWG
jgi:hypothetical protein